MKPPKPLSVNASAYIKCMRKPKLTSPIAIVGSAGLRSIGEIAIDFLVEHTAAKKFAHLYSPYFPVFYSSQPSYVADPSMPGQAGAVITDSIGGLPTVGFYFLRKSALIFIRGYHADFKGQYDAAEATLNFCRDLGVRRILVLAGYGQKGDPVCCATSSQSLLDEMKNSGIAPCYEGPFYGFSGLLFGLSQIFGMESIALFAQTTPTPDDPEYPDVKGAKALLGRLLPMLNLQLNIDMLSEQAVEEDLSKSSSQFWRG